MIRRICITIAVILCGGIHWEAVVPEVSGFVIQPANPGALPASQFVSTKSTSDPITTTTTKLNAIKFDDLASRVVSYEVTIPKPLGVVFGENPEPFFGLSIDDVTDGMNGSIGGLRKGDQLLSVNERVVVGKDFDTVMGLLQDEPKNLDLLFYRGPVSQLYTVLNNQDLLKDLDDDDGYDDEDSEPVVMDENYESPVKVEVKEQKPLTAGDFLKAAGKLGSIAVETLTSKPDENVPTQPQQPKKKTGFFGIGGETVQLDGDEAQGYSREKIKPDDF